MLKRCHLTYLAFAVCLGQPLLPSSAEEGKKVTLRFVSIPHIENPQPIKLEVGKDKTMEIEIPTTGFSPPYEVEARANWTVVDAVSGEGGRFFIKELGTTPALASSEQLIVLVRKGERNADGFDVIPIDIHIDRFGGGKFLFVNATEFEFGGEVGGHAFGIEPGQYSIVEPKPETAGSKLCHGTLYYTKDGKEKPFFSSKWPVSEQARGLFFLYQDLSNSRLRLHSIRDFF